MPLSIPLGHWPGQRTRLSGAPGRLCLAALWAAILDARSSFHSLPCAAMDNPDDLCPRAPKARELGTQPHSPPIYLASVDECRDPEQADALRAGRESGYGYIRDSHPNADMLAEKCRELH